MGERVRAGRRRIQTLWLQSTQKTLGLRRSPERGRLAHRIDLFPKPSPNARLARLTRGVNNPLIPFELRRRPFSRTIQRMERFCFSLILLGLFFATVRAGDLPDF